MVVLLSSVNVDVDVDVFVSLEHHGPRLVCELCKKEGRFFENEKNGVDTPNRSIK
jgi:hypothetical protein